MEIEKEIFDEYILTFTISDDGITIFEEKWMKKSQWLRKKKLKKLKVADKDLKRQLDLMYNAYTLNQIAPEKMEAIIKLQTDIENKFSTFRPEVNGKNITDNDVEKILKTSTSSTEVEKISNIINAIVFAGSFIVSLMLSYIVR